MAKRKGGRRRSFTLPIAALIGVAVPLMDPVKKIVEHGDWTSATYDLSYRFAMYNMGTKKFQFNLEGWGPILAGFALHWLASRLGLNRALGRAGVPILRI